MFKMATKHAALGRNRAARTAASVAFVGLLALLSGCVGGTESPSSSGDGPSVGEKANLKVLSQFGDNPALQGVLDQLSAEYERQHPEVTVDIQYLTLDDLTRTVPTMLASGEGPDIIDYDANESTLGDLAKSGLLHSLNDYAEQYDWSSRLPESVTERTTYDDELYGIGRSSEAVGLFYSEDLFNQYDLAAPTTYADFQAAADALKSNGITPVAFGNKDQWPSSHLVGAAIHAEVPVSDITAFETLAGDGSWTERDVEDSMQTVVDWVNDGYLTPNFNGISFDDAAKQFFAGKAGMFIEGTGLTPDILSNMKGANVRFIPFPMIDDSIPQQAEGGLGGAWAVNATSQAPDVAADWLNFVHFSPAAEQAWLEAGVLPTTDYDGQGANVPPLVQDNLTVVQAAQDGGGIGYWTGYSSSPLVTDAWNGGAQSLLDGELDPGQFADQLQSALEQARDSAQ